MPLCLLRCRTGECPESPARAYVSRRKALKDRIRSVKLRQKLMSAEDAASLIRAGCTVGMSGFTGSGYPKAVPLAWRRGLSRTGGGQAIPPRVWTGASTGPELDGAFARPTASSSACPTTPTPSPRKDQ